MTSRLNPGDPVPDFKLNDQDGNPVSSADLDGRWVLYFYPADDTPGCTAQACQFNEIDFGDVPVFGVSPDDEASHVAFRAKYGLGFRLLCDPDAEVAKNFGAWGTKNLYGREYTGLLRSTFVINDGTIEHAFYNVRADGNAARVRDAISG